MNKNMLIGAGALLAIYWGYRMSLPKGIRNNNPGNIEYNSSNNWDGQTGSDGRFAIFNNMDDGVRALTKLLFNYYQQGNFTIRQMINKYAPGSENNTKSYIDHVSKVVGKSPDTMLGLSQDLEPLVRGIIAHENGRNIREDDLQAGLQRGYKSIGMA